MLSSRLVTQKKRSSNNSDQEQDDPRRQRLSTSLYRSKSLSIRSRIPEISIPVVCETRKRAAPPPPSVAAPPEAEKDDADCEFFKQLRKKEWSDADNCLWLSADVSGSSSPSSCFDDHRLYALSNMDSNSVSQRLLFVKMLLAKSNPDSSREKSLPECSSADEKSSVVGARNEAADDSGSLKFSEYNDVSKLGSSESLVNLNEENSDWNSSTDLEVDFLQQDFPSPCCKSRESSSNQTSDSRMSKENYKETGSVPFVPDVNIEACNSEEPLFWPPDLRSAWVADAASGELFAMSPPKKKLKLKLFEEDKAEILKVEEVDLDAVNTDEPLVWPSEQKLDWNLFTMSPAKKNHGEVTASQNMVADSGAEAVNLEDFRPDEPLVWPSDQKFDWSPEAVCDLFNMSPPKKKSKLFKHQSNLSSLKVNKSSAPDSEAENLENIDPDEPLVWPSDKKFELGSSESVFNLFIMSPLKRKQGDGLQETAMNVLGDDDLPLFWPSNSAFCWDSETARSFFTMSPRKNTPAMELKTKGRRNRVAAAATRKSPRVVELRSRSGFKGVLRTQSMPVRRRDGRF